MTDKILEDKSLVKQFNGVLEQIPSPEIIRGTSVDGVFKECLDYVFDVARRMRGFFLVKSFNPAMAATNIDKDTLNNLRFWASLANKSPDAVMKEMYFGDHTLAYLKKLLSVDNPENAIQYVEMVFGIKANTKNLAELNASICNTVTKHIYSNVIKAKHALGKYLETPEKKSFFGMFKGREDR